MSKRACVPYVLGLLGLFLMLCWGCDDDSVGQGDTADAPDLSSDLGPQLDARSDVLTADSASDTGQAQLDARDTHMGLDDTQSDTTDGSSDTAADVVDTSVPPTPSDRTPCDAGDCWLTAPDLTGACGTATIRENFYTGLYNVHRYPLAAPAGEPVEITLTATQGAWTPGLVVLDLDGTTLFDGDIALSGGAGGVEVIASTSDANSAMVTVLAQADSSVHVFVTSWEVIDGGFAPAIPTEARYTLTAFVDCPLPDAVCPMAPENITLFGSGYFTTAENDDPASPNYSPYKRDGRSEHSGYDIYAALGVDVVATQSGTIIEAVTTDTGLCGLSVNLAADSGVTFRYCHLDTVSVTGGRVEAGQVIGTNGKTGNANSAHVHFVYLDAPSVTGPGTSAQKSEKVNAYVDSLCQ